MTTSQLLPFLFLLAVAIFLLLKGLSCSNNQACRNIMVTFFMLSICAIFIGLAMVAIYNQKNEEAKGKCPEYEVVNEQLYKAK